MDFREDRVNKGYSQKAYADKLGISERILRYYESGDIEIPPLKLPELIKRAKKLKSVK